MHTRLNRVHDLNFLRAEDPGDATAEELTAEAERVQGAHGIRHRSVNVRLTPTTGLQRLYEKLGFETVGRYARFLKPNR